MHAFHKDLKVLHFNCEEPRSYFIPYSSREDALLSDRYNSEYYFNLDGVWNFKYYSTFEDVSDDICDCECNDSIKVPGCWQLELDKGYDVPNYSNLKYPFPIDPPHVPIDNPCGHYRKKFDYVKDENKRYFINLEGVSSCFYLYLNGIFVAYSQVSHCTSEIELTKYIVDGENTIDILVVKWCDGSYLEDQDMFRLSGIFRDIYILARDNIHVKDIDFRYSVSEDLKEAQIDLLIEGSDAYNFELLDSSGNQVYSGACGKFILPDPVLWNSEEPYLYKLIINSGSEFIPLDISFKKLEIKGNIAYFNNKPIKLFGINRHDSNPVTGYYTDTEHMLQDLIILKKANVNCIRTSHYPNSPLFLEMCNKYGFMVVDEADIETHGMGFEYRDTWDWTRWSGLSNWDEWEESYIDRAKRLYERDKNFGCVIMWSLGNESGCGKNHRAMREYIKSRNSGAIVHYENSHLEFKAVPIGENFSDISDVESRMYSSLEYTEAYAKNKNSKKPFYFCEFSCSMSTGDAQAHADLIRKYPAIFGGCFWELTDHAVQISENKYRYGGDFGDYPNDDICCVDGIVFPDRSLRPGFYDIKKAFEPFECSYENGKIIVFNRKYFTDLNDYYLEINLEDNGKKVYTKIIDNLDIKPQSSKEFSIDINGFHSDNLFLNVLLKTCSNSYWSDKGFEVAFAQFELSDISNQASYEYTDAPYLSDKGRYIEIISDTVRYVFDKSYGRISQIIYKDISLLSDPFEICVWKAPGNNEIGTVEDCKSAFMNYAGYRAYDCDIRKGDKCIEIVCNCAVGGPAVIPFLKGSLRHVFTSDGLCRIEFSGDYRSLLKEMNMRPPKFGFRFTMDSSYKNMIYFGKGPVETYQERHYSQKYGKYSTTVYENFVPYIFPMENGAHYGTRYAYVTNENKVGLMFRPLHENSFIFNASNYKAETLEKVKHNDELPEPENTYVTLDYKMIIRGGRGIYETLEPERTWELKPFKFAVSVNPVEL